MKPESLRQLTISANFAISADGKISSVEHLPSGWTSAADHQRLLDLRRGTDAIFVGRNTLQSDNMSLTIPGHLHQPLRCIASGSGQLTGEEKVFHTLGGAIHLWCQQSPKISLPGVTLHRRSLLDFLETLHQKHGVNHLHCEGGGTLLRSLLGIDCLDELHLTWAAHTLFGGLKAPTLTGIPDSPLLLTKHFELAHYEPLAGLGEIFLTYRRCDQAATQ